MLEKIKAVIFDMDGTLIDSMWIWAKIDMDFLKKRDIEVPEDLKENIEHMTFTDVAKYFKERFKLCETIDEIIDEWNQMAYLEYIQNVNLKPGAVEYLKLLKSMGIKIALATSNSTMLLEAVLKNKNVFHFFDAITTSDEVERGKNFPDIYLLTAEKLGVDPKECIVFEDILPAIMGAKSAGMKVIGVYDAYSDYQKDSIVEAADHYITNYFQLTDAV